MIRGYVYQTTAIALLLSQVLLAVVGGPLLVQCRGTNDHAAIELAHNACDDTANDALLSRAIATTMPAVESAALPEQLTTDGHCVDTPLAQPPVRPQDNRAVLAAIPALWAYQIAELPELHPAAPGACRVCVPVFQPDSAESLARSVVLLI